MELQLSTTKETRSMAAAWASPRRRPHFDRRRRILVAAATLTGGMLMCVLLGLVGYLYSGWWRHHHLTAARSMALFDFEQGVSKNRTSLLTRRRQILFDWIQALPVSVSDVDAGHARGDARPLATPAWSNHDALPILVADSGRDTLAFGLPFRCFVGSTETSPSGAPGPSQVVRIGSSPGDLPWSLVFPSEGPAVPTHVIGWAFLANSMCWGILLYAGVTLPRAIQGAIRRRSGCCAFCGYDLRAATGTHVVCPECGESAVRRL